MKVLHISHHIGCMRDHQYIYDKLTLDYEFYKFPKGLFYITKGIANQMWNERKDYYNSFDFIVTSDTAPLSRIFMENINELKGKLIVWICNRFDYNMENDITFYQIFKQMAIIDKTKIKIIPYSDFEYVWCKFKGIQLLYNTITPIGINSLKDDSKIDKLLELQNSYLKDQNSIDKYNTPTELKDKCFIPIYSNDNIYFRLKDVLKTNNISVFNGGYKHPTDLQNCKCFITFPDAYSKLITFETIQNKVIVFLPSEDYLIKLHQTSNNNAKYWFNCPFGLLNKEKLQYCEWYRYKECRIYFDSIEDMIFKIQNLSDETIAEKQSWCEKYGKEIEETNINKWNQIFN